MKKLQKKYFGPSDWETLNTESSRSQARNPVFALGSVSVLENPANQAIAMIKFQGNE